MWPRKERFREYGLFHALKKQNYRKLKKSAAVFRNTVNTTTLLFILIIEEFLILALYSYNCHDFALGLYSLETSPMKTGPNWKISYNSYKNTVFWKVNQPPPTMDKLRHWEGQQLSQYPLLNAGKPVKKRNLAILSPKSSDTGKAFI